MLSWLTDFTVRRSTSMFSSLSNRVDVLPRSLMSNFPLSKALEALKTGWPDSVTIWSIIIPAVLSHSPFGASEQGVAPRLFESWSQEWPMTTRESASILRDFFQNCESILCLSLHSISLNIDIKMIPPSNSSGSHCMLFIKFLNFL